MNKDKLIGLIIKKSTYKDTKPVQADIFKNKQKAVVDSIAAIQQILKQDYNAEAKLYAVRYLKDCFEKGSEKFINETQKKILLLLEKFVEDSYDEKAILKYAGSYTKTADLETFKSLITSFFIMSRQCIQKWASWINDPSREFVKVRDRIAKKHGLFTRDFQYYRVQNQQIFRQNCANNKVKLPPPQNKPKMQKQIPTPKHQKLPQNKPKMEQQTSTPKHQPQMQSNKETQRIITTIQKIQNNINKMTKEEFKAAEIEFNTAIEQYCQVATEYDDKLIEQSFEKIEDLKTKLKMRLNKEKQVPKQPTTNEKKKEEIKMKQIQKKLDNLAPQFKSPQEKISIPVKGQKEQEEKKQIKKQANQQVKKQTKFEESHKQSIMKQPSSLENYSKLSGGFVDERVNFSVSDSDYSDDESRNPSKLSKIKQQQYNRNTAKFITPPVPPKTQNKHKKQLNPIHQVIETSPHQASNSKIQFNNSLSQTSSINDPVRKEMNQMNSTLNKQLTRIKKQNDQKALEKIALQNKVFELQRQINLLQNTEKKRINQLQNSTSQTQVNNLKKELIEEKKEKNLLMQEVNQLKNQMRKVRNESEKKEAAERNLIEMSRLKPQQSQLKEQLHDSKLSRSQYKVTKISPSNVEEIEMKRYQLMKLMSPPEDKPFSPRIDQDYIDNKTHFSNIGSWLSPENVANFKLCVLGLSEIFYQDENIVISQVSHLFSEDSSDFLKMSYSFRFKRCQDKPPHVKYKNVPEVDLWTKPLTGKLECFMQEIVGKLCMVPMKIMKCQIECERNLRFSVLLPFLYYNYLKPQEFQAEQFDEVFKSRSQFIIKSKVFYLNGMLADSPKKFIKVLKGAALQGNTLELCLGEQSYQRVFMIQIQFLKNQKAIVRILPIPATGSMSTKAKQLLNNLIFLIGQ